MSDDEPGTRWCQVNLRCETWQDAEQMAIHHLGPHLADAEHTGQILAWWFIRKRETWRLRVLPAPGHDAPEVLGQVTGALAASTALGHAAVVRYEPETRRFGGPHAMALAHALFHADSRHILTHLAHSADHRRELGVRLATRLMLAAGQDLYEQGDVWAQVAEHRRTGQSEPSPATIAAVQTLIAAHGDADDSPLTQSPDWPAAFETTGHALAELAQQGRLTRGLRAVLTDHLLFAFNRLGIPAAHQNVLATAASNAIFHRERIPDRAERNGRADSIHPSTVRTVTMPSTDTPALDPHVLCEDLIAAIDRLGYFTTPEVKAAVRAVRRELFLPGVDLPTAYSPKAVVTKRAVDGTAVSSASSPGIVVGQLEQLDPRPGMSVMEIGAATGVNAAYLAELVRKHGTVTTIEYDEDLADGARAHLATAGYHQVTVLCRDGALGDPGTTFDRIIVTAGAWDIAAAWWDQLVVGGRIVVPLRLHGSGLTRSLAFTRTDETRMISADALVCGFVPMRGATEMGEIHVRLADDIILKIDAADQPDQDALAKALSYPADATWTGIHVRHDEPAEHLDLWLATAATNLHFARLTVGATARDLGLANPALRWSGATLYNNGTLTYLTARPVDDDTDELGITTHGPDTDKLNDQVTDLLHHWNQRRPTQPRITAYPATTEDNELEAGVRVTRPDSRLTIAW